MTDRPEGPVDGDGVNVDVAVIGGGLGGATAALAFARQGCTVRLFERRDLTRDPNRGDLLHAPTVAVLDGLGLIERLDAQGAVRLRRMVVADPDGEIFATDQPAETRLLNHAEMEAVFLEAAEEAGVVVQRDAVRALEPTATGWRLGTDHGDLLARFVVGADGADSLTRRTLGIELADEFDYPEPIVVLHADRPDWLEPGTGWTLLHPKGTVITLPTSPEGRIRLIVPVPRDETREWATASEEALSARLGARYPGLEGIRVSKRGGSHVYRLRRSHAARYSGPAAALVGDAAHTTNTYGGQGLNMAIRDGAALAAHVGPLLADPATRRGDLVPALEAYEAERRPENTAILTRAHDNSPALQSGPEAYEFGLALHRRMAAQHRA